MTMGLFVCCPAGFCGQPWRNGALKRGACRYLLPSAADRSAVCFIAYHQLIRADRLSGGKITADIASSSSVSIFPRRKVLRSFSGWKQRLTAFSSLPGVSLAASSCRRFRFRKSTKDFPSRKNSCWCGRERRLAGASQGQCHRQWLF